ncbi:MAG: thymidine kinase [Clostridia bacterium]
MGKLIFKYGAMGSAKTANLLMTAYNFEEKNKIVQLLKPRIDTRDGSYISSRIGIQRECTTFPTNVLISDIYNIHAEILFVDECQFLTSSQVEDLADLADSKNLLIFCYGLRTDFMSNLFEGSKRLFELADKIEEVKSICECGKKASINSRIDEKGNIIFNGEQILVGGNDSYKPLCRECWYKKIKS